MRIGCRGDRLVRVLHAAGFVLLHAAHCGEIGRHHFLRYGLLVLFQYTASSLLLFWLFCAFIPGKLLEIGLFYSF